jgi:hypothetical protein
MRYRWETRLEKLDAPKGYGSFYVGSALPRELGYLENLGYLRFKQGLEGLDDLSVRQAKRRQLIGLG